MTRAKEFLIFYLERYRYYKGLSGEDVEKLFQSKGVSEYIPRHFGALHVMSEEAVINEIDEFLSES